MGKRISWNTKLTISSGARNHMCKTSEDCVQSGKSDISEKPDWSLILLMVYPSWNCSHNSTLMFLYSPLNLHGFAAFWLDSYFHVEASRRSHRYSERDCLAPFSSPKFPDCSVHFLRLRPSYSVSDNSILCCIFLSDIGSHFAQCILKRAPSLTMQYLTGVL